MLLMIMSARYYSSHWQLIFCDFQGSKNLRLQLLVNDPQRKNEYSGRTTFFENLASRGSNAKHASNFAMPSLKVRQVQICTAIATESLNAVLKLWFDHCDRNKGEFLSFWDWVVRPEREPGCLWPMGIFPVWAFRPGTHPGAWLR